MSSSNNSNDLSHTTLDQMNSTAPNVSTETNDTILIKGGDVATTSNLAQDVHNPTKFHDTANVSTLIMDTVHPDLSLTDRFAQFDFKKWFSIPYICHQFAWSSNQAAFNQTEFIDLPTALFNDKVFYDKLKAFRYFRCKFRITFRINGTSMHYGKLAVIPIPYPSGYASNATNGFWAGSHINSVSILNAPHVTLSPTENSTQSIELPWSLPAHWIDLDHYSGGDVMYRLVIMPIVQLRTVAASDPLPIQVTTYCQVIDPEFSVLSADRADFFDPNLYEWNIKAVPNTMLSYDLPIIQSSTKSDQIVHLHDTRPQSTQSDEEKSKSASGMLAHVTEATEMLSASVGTAATLAPLVAACLGKPTDVNQTARMAIMPESLAHGHGSDLARPLSVFPTNSVKALNSNTKYRSIVDLAKCYSYIEKVTVTGTDRHRFQVTPLICRVAFAQENEDYVNIYHTNLSAASRFFNFWSGSIVFKFQVVCSQFHSGRMRVSWVPFDLKQSSSQLSATYNQVIDLQMNTEFEIVVPYYGLGPQRTVSLNDFNGILMIDMINPITSGIPVSSKAEKVEMLVWVKAGDDFRLYRPTLSMYSDVPPSFSTSPGDGNASVQSSSKVFLPHVKPQSSFATLKESAISYDGMTMGEDVPTILQLAKRPTTYDVDSETTTKDFYMVYNWWANCDHTRTWMKAMSSFFRFWRGSVVTKVVLPGTGVTFSNRSYTFSPRDNLETTKSVWKPYSSSDTPVGSSEGAEYFPNSRFAIPTARIPFYSNLPMLPVPGDSTLHNTDLPGTTVTLPSLEIRAFDSKYVSLLVSVGDDFEYLFFIGASAERVSRSMYFPKYDL
jgi:hypothetical protein